MKIKEKIIAIALIERFMVGHPTIYNVLKKARLKFFVLLNSKYECYKTISYGIKRLVKVGKSFEDKFRWQIKRDNERLEGIYWSALMIFHVGFMRAFIRVMDEC